MGHIAQVILDWSEVWALLFPLTAYLLLRRQPDFFTPILIYICGAFALNLLSDIIGGYKRYLPEWIQTNLILYNIHSFFRFACFLYFFSCISQMYFRLLRKVILGIYLLLISTNEIFLENYLDQAHINGNLFTVEAYFLLIYCLLYYLSKLRNEGNDFQETKEFWIVTGLSIYVVINFFIFLFYVPMIQENSMLAEKMWSVHNLAYITLCLFITKAIYVPLRPEHST